MPVKLNIIYTNIGRGHPFYLDGIVSALSSTYSNRIELNITDVFKISSGLSRNLWKVAATLYRMGSQGGIIGRLYGNIRKSQNNEKPGRAQNLMARGILRFLNDNPYPTLVAHPILAGMISNKVPCFYQHGEIAVPEEAKIGTAKRIFAPLDMSMDLFPNKDNIMTSGLCIEPELVPLAEYYYKNREGRLNAEQILTGAFFSSGAEPIGHLVKIIQAIKSLLDSENRTIVFCKSGGNLDWLLRRELRVEPINYNPDIDTELLINRDNIIALSHKNRQEENEAAIKFFKYFDYLVAPSHERTNWAVGLGLPMFVLFPLIGSFSPLNFEFITESKTGIAIEDDKMAENFVSLLNHLRTGDRLIEMSRNGWGRYEINGFDNIARYLVENVS